MDIVAVGAPAIALNDMMPSTPAEPARDPNPRTKGVQSKSIPNSANRTLPPFLRDLISPVPPAGGGIHNWLYRCARQLHAHRSHNDIVALLAAQTEGCGRHVPIQEIEAAVSNSLTAAWRPNGVAPAPARASKWPARNAPKVRAILESGFTLADLWESSPVRLGDDGPGTEEIVDVLFPGNPLLCCGADQRHPETMPREGFRGRLANLALVVPSTMTKSIGTTKEGRPSPRTLSNVGPRRFLVVEFDQGSTDEQAAVLAHLSDFAPLILAVHSGGKSLHGWFRAAHDEQVTRRFFAYAVSLGADPATWTTCQFVRMPGGTRDSGARQQVWFFNPAPAHAY